VAALTHARATRRSVNLSHKVTERSDALDLRQGVFKRNEFTKIASALTRSAKCGRR